jgi:hypothetical protein
MLGVVLLVLIGRCTHTCTRSRPHPTAPAPLAYWLEKSVCTMHEWTVIVNRAQDQQPDMREDCLNCFERSLLVRAPDPGLVLAQELGQAGGRTAHILKVATVK